MKTKLSLFFLLVISLIWTVSYFVSVDIPTPLSERVCAFCDENVLTTHKFYEDDLVLALCTYRPIFPGHSLIIPRRHVERFESLTEEEINQIGKVIKMVNQASIIAYGTSSYVLLQKNGLEAGQTVPHVHFHYIPRQLGETSALKFIVYMFLADKGNPLNSEEMQAATAKMREAISNRN